MIKIQPSRIDSVSVRWCTVLFTVYPKKYAHGFCFAVLCCGYTLTDFPISIRLTSLALWQSNDCPSASKATLMNMDKYFMWIHYERLHNHNKAKHNKTVCIFLGIYCKFWWWHHNRLHSGPGNCDKTTWKVIFNSLDIFSFVAMFTTARVRRIGILGNSCEIGLRWSPQNHVDDKSILVHASQCWSGPWFNIKMSSYQYRKSHCGDKTVVRSSYHHNGISYTGKMTSFYWISPQDMSQFLSGCPVPYLGHGKLSNK